MKTRLALGGLRERSLCIGALLLMFSCQKPEDSGAKETGDVTTIPTIEWEFNTVVSPTLSDGFGTSLALSNSKLYIGAPHGEPGGAVYSYDNAGQMNIIMQGEPASALGAALAYSEGDLYIAAPLSDSGAGAVYREDGLAITGVSGQLLGKRLFSTADGIYASSTTGLFRVMPPSIGGIVNRLNLEFIAQGPRIGGFTTSQDSLYIGTPYAESSVTVGDATLQRESPLDEAGYALCRADLAYDARYELVVGAPGANRVDIFSETETGALELSHSIRGGEGRFGHAVSCNEGLLIVGAPLYGTQNEGALWRFEGDLSTWSIEDEPFINGTAAWAQLGFDIELGALGQIYAGAPGGASTLGSVSVYAPVTP